MSIVASERPASFRIGRVFGDSFRVFGRNVGLCLGLAAIFSGLPTFIYYTWILGNAAGMTPESMAALEQGGFDATKVLLSIGVGIAYFLLSAILQAALVRGSIEDLNGETPLFSDCIRTAFSVLWPSLGIALLVSIGVGLASLLLIVPGVILWLRWSVALPVLVQERLGVTGSMSRSAELTKGSRWALLGLYVILGIASWVLQVGFLALAGTIMAAAGNTAGAFVLAMISTVTTIAFTIANAVTYAELRLLKEGTSVKDLAEIFA